MGFSTLIDILGSTIIGGLLLLILLRMNDTAVENNYLFSGEKIVQQNLLDIVRLIEYDFTKIGYCKDWTKIPDPAKAIISATDTSISFLTDVAVSQGNLEGDGVPDTLKYYLGTKEELSSTPNPNDRILYRVVNNQTARGSNLGVTQFKLTYFDALGDTLHPNEMPASPPLGICTIQIDVAVENPAAYGDDYSSERKVIWRQIRLAARNLKTR
ncbi:hypothetical protein [Rosettibacter firmus]|uniref:hypothetical protein n=1 Tax=Rosettibacter firmus TaxID=3111522 RepID=UPI00336C0C45